MCPNITPEIIALAPIFTIFIVKISLIYTINDSGTIGSKGEQQIPSNYISKTSYNYRQE
ncbi:hypothetical protein P3J6_120182 [Pseudoalteromonas sp. 3J6]|nr:hypothetical protein P3J6_120182 [Pseudoalteromonas sp. 3J6]